MGGSGKMEKTPIKDHNRTKVPPPPKTDDDDCEDGDIASPKQDRYGNDDEPLE
jgi:hypothetical protein